MTPTTTACATPLDATVLMDYWLADLAADAEARVEEHLLSCDVCGDRLRETMSLAQRLHALARTGTLQVIVDDGFVRHARERGLRVRDYAVTPAGSVQCTVSADDDMLIARLAMRMSAVARVDLSWCDELGAERQRMVDVPVHQDSGEVICQQSIQWAKASPSMTMVARLLAVDEAGGEELLGEYTFHHTRTIPGAPGWEPV